jgi:hypothetical protein
MTIRCQPLIPTLSENAEIRITCSIQEEFISLKTLLESLSELFKLEVNQDVKLIILKRQVNLRIDSDYYKKLSIWLCVVLHMETRISGELTLLNASRGYLNWKVCAAKLSADSESDCEYGTAVTSSLKP